MISHLPSAVSDLLLAGMEIEEVALLLAVPPADVQVIVAGAEPESLTFGGAIRLGKVIYVLHELRCNLMDDAERLRILRIESSKIGGKDEEERFGVPLQVLRAVEIKYSGIIRCGCYVPTRAEVALQDPAWLKSVLIDWWWESPTELVPTDAQIEDVLHVLRTRKDANSPEIQEIIHQSPG